MCISHFHPVPVYLPILRAQSVTTAAMTGTSLTFDLYSPHRTCSFLKSYSIFACLQSVYPAEWDIPMQYEDCSSAGPGTDRESATHIWIVIGWFHSASLLAALSDAEMEASFKDDNMYRTP